MFQNTNVPQWGSHSIGGSSSAVLYLFSPRQFSNQAKRPFLYKFDGNFIPEAMDAISHKVSTQSGARINAMTANPMYLTSMVPGMMPDHMVNMKTMAEFWTFMLVVNNDKPNVGQFTRSMSDNLQIYYGYFQNEPINPLSHFGRDTLNHEAVLLVTHKTIVNKSIYQRDTGTGVRIDTMADIDSIPAATMAYLSDRQTVTMRPDDLYKSMSMEPTGMCVAIHDEGRLLANSSGSIDIHSRLSVPKNNIQKILDGVADTMSSIQTEASHGAVTNLGTDTFTMLLEQNLSDNSRSIDHGLPTDILLHLSYVLQRYNPAIQRVDLPFNQPYDVQDQSSGSAKNAFSSMLAAVMPVIMTDYTLAQISFRYVSYLDEFQIYGVSPMTPMPDYMTKQRVNNFIFRMRKEIFPILKLQHGDFDLNINCDSTSVTHINLNFEADNIKTKEIFEVPTILGGFNSPLIGSSDMADYNAKELTGLITSIHEEDRDVALGHYDINSYNQALASYDANAYKPQSTQSYNNLQPPKIWSV